MMVVIFYLAFLTYLIIDDRLKIKRRKKVVDLNVMKEKNPFAKEDGTPKEEHAAEFVEWEAKKDLKKINKLPPEEREKVLKSRERFANRMQG